MKKWQKKNKEIRNKKYERIKKNISNNKRKYFIPN